VLAAFCMRHMAALRLTAIASNLAFIAYGASAGLDPVLMLHVLLLPLNAARLLQERATPRPGRAAAAPSRPGEGPPAAP
jgi:CRP/FNR family transcriptional regulator, cyclic AMP receptor protein